MLVKTDSDTFSKIYKLQKSVKLQRNQSSACNYLSFINSYILTYSK